MSATRSLESYTWSGVGYQPLVFTRDWQVALLNWEPVLDPANLGEIERHNATDEVFVLLRGQAVLFTFTPLGDFAAEEMQPGVVYNVPRAAWHNLVATRDAAWVITENRDTHLGDTEVRRMTEHELRQLTECLPDWARTAREETTDG